MGWHWSKQLNRQLVLDHVQCTANGITTVVTLQWCTWAFFDRLLPVSCYDAKIIMGSFTYTHVHTLVSFPGLLRFCCLVCVDCDYCQRKPKNKKRGRPGSRVYTHLVGLGQGASTYTRVYTCSLITCND